MFCPACGRSTKDSVTASQVSHKKRAFNEFVYEALDNNLDQRFEIGSHREGKKAFSESLYEARKKPDDNDADQRFEIARRFHRQSRAFCLDKSKNKQIKNTRVNYPLNGSDELL